MTDPHKPADNKGARQDSPVRPQTEILYPVDTANFKWLRERGCVYADKTSYIPKLIRTGKYYFLARPRRFGKSLFLDTLAEYFAGNRPLFRGLDIDRLEPEEWETYPVIRLNMSGKGFTEETDLVKKVETQLRNLEKQFDLPVSDSDFEDRFETLIHNISEKYHKKAVILIDEYDAPLSSTIDNPELQETYREQLHGLYSILKNAEPYIHFCFLTGVTRYGKVSVFSGLNNLNDISFLDEYAAICGITTPELELYYREGVSQLAEKEGLSFEEALRLLKFNYDGYHFSESMTDIYNPFSINYAMHNCKIDDYWCQSGVPTILSKSILHNDFDISRLNGKKVDKTSLTDLSVYALNPIPLFYQTGYLTLKAFEPRRRRFTVGYPNREVESSILNNILELYLPSTREKKGAVYDMEDALEEGKPQEFINLLSSFLSDIPNQLHKYVARYENYYHTVFYCLTTLMGLDVEAEYSTSEGFIDMLVKTSGYIYVIELKINGTAEDAMAQIEERHYAAPFTSDPRKLVKIGLGFSTETHNIATSLILPTTFNEY